MLTFGIAWFLAASFATATTTNFTFETSYTASGIDQWGSTSDGYANSATYQQFLGAQWDTSTNFGGFSTGLFGEKYGFEGSAYTNGKVGLDVFFKGTTGSLDINLVNNVKLAVTDLSLDSGATGTIHITQNRITPTGGNVLTSVFPTMEMSVDASFQIDAGIRGEFAYGVGSTNGSVDLADIKNVIAVTTANPLLLLTNPFDTKLRIFSYNLNNSHLVTVGASTGTLFGTVGVSDILGRDLPIADLDSPAGLNVPLTTDKFISPTRIGNYDVAANTAVEFGSITIHDPNMLDLSSGTNLTVSGTQARILSLGVDPIGLATIAAGYPANPLDPKVTIPGTELTVEATLLKAQLNLDLGANQTISLAPNTYVRLLSNYDVTYTVNGQSVTTSDLRYLLPNDGSAADIQITGKPTQADWTLTPTVYVAPTVSNLLQLNLAASVQVTAGALTLSSGIIGVPVIPPLYNANFPISNLGQIDLLNKTLNLGNLTEFQGVYRSLRPLVGGAVPESFSVGLGENVLDEISGAFKAQPIAGTLTLINSVFDNVTPLDIPGTFNLSGASNIAGSNGLTVSGTLRIDKGSRFIDSAAGFVDANGLVATGTYNIAGRLSYDGPTIKTIGGSATFNLVGDLGDPTHFRIDNNGADAFAHLEQINGKLSLTNVSIATDKLLVNNGQLSVLGTGNLTSKGYLSTAGSVLAVGGGNTLDVSGGFFSNLDAAGALTNFSAALGDTTGATFIFHEATGIVSNPGTLILSGTRPTLGYFANKTGSSTYTDGLATLTTNSGTLVLAGGATQSLSGDLTNALGAKIGITMPATPTTPVAPFSSLSIAGSLTNAGSLIIDGGRFAATSIYPTPVSLVQLTRNAEVNLSGTLGSSGTAPSGHWLLDGIVRYDGTPFTTISALSDVQITGANHGFRLTNGTNALGTLASNAGTFALLAGAQLVTSAAFTNTGLFGIGQNSGFTSDGLASNTGAINISLGGVYDTTAGFNSHWSTGNSIPLTAEGFLTGGGTMAVGGVLFFASPKRADGGAPLTGVAAGTTLALTHQAANTLTSFNYAFGNSLVTVTPSVAVQGPNDLFGNPTYTYTNPEIYDGFQNFSTVAGTLVLGGGDAERTNASFSILSGGSLSIAAGSTLMVTGASFHVASGSTVDLKGNLILGGGANTTSFAVPDGFTFGANTQLGRVVLSTYTNPTTLAQTSYYTTTGQATLNSAGNWTNPGSIAGAGTIHGQSITNTGAISAVGGTLVLDNPGGTLTNSGSLVSGGNSLYSSRLTISNMNVVNSASAQLFAGSNFDLNHATVTGGLVNVTGTGRLSLLDTTLANVTLTSDGAIDILNNNGGSSTIGGSLTLRSSSVLTVKGNGTSGATLNFAPGSTIDNGGRINVQAGANVAGATITNHSLVAFSGPRTGNLDNLSNASDGVITLAHGTNLQLNGTYTNAGRIELSDEPANALPSGVTVSHGQISLLGNTTLTGGGTFQLGGTNTFVSAYNESGTLINYLSTQWRNGSLDLGNVTVTSPTAGTMLTIANQTISGQGQLGDGQLAIINDVNGVIRVLGNGSTLTINTYADPNPDPASTVVDGFRNLGTLDIGEGAKLVVTGGAFHSFANGVLSEGRYRFAGTLQIDGLTSFDNAATLVFGSSTGRITNSAGDTLPIRNNLATGSLEVRDGATYSFATTAAVPFTNSGTLLAGPGGTLGITGGYFSNYANHALTGGSYSVAGTFKFADADIFTNAANLTLRGGRIQDLNGLDGLRNFSTNAGVLKVADNSTFTLSSAVPVFHQRGSVIVDAGSILDFGNTTVNNFQADAISGGKSDYYVTGTIKSANEFNTNGAHVTLYSNTANLQVAGKTIPQSVGGGGTLTMAGGYTRTYGSGTPFANGGLWEIGSPVTPTLAGGTIRSGASITFGSTVADAAIISGGGTTRFYGGATDDNTATNLTINNLTVNGTLDLNNTVNIGNGGQLTVNGTLANTVSALNLNRLPAAHLTPIVFATITVTGGLDLRFDSPQLEFGAITYNHTPGASIGINGMQLSTRNDAAAPKITWVNNLTLSNGATLTRIVPTGPTSWTYVSMLDDLALVSGATTLTNTRFESRSTLFTNSGTMTLSSDSSITFGDYTSTGINDIPGYNIPVTGDFLNGGTITGPGFVAGPQVVVGNFSNYGTFASTLKAWGGLTNYGNFSGRAVADSVVNNSAGIMNVDFLTTGSLTNYGQFSGSISGGNVVNKSSGTFSGNGTIASFTNDSGVVTGARFIMKGDGNGGFGVVENNFGNLTLRSDSFLRDNGVASPIWNSGTLHVGGPIANDITGFGTIRLDGSTSFTGDNGAQFGDIYVDHGTLSVTDEARLGGSYFGNYGKVFVASGATLGLSGTLSNHSLFLFDGATINGFGATPGIIPAGVSSSGTLTLTGGLTLGGINAKTLVLGGNISTSSATLEDLTGAGILTITNGVLRLNNATLSSANVNYGIRITDPNGSASLVGPTLDASIDSLGTNIFFDGASPLTYRGIISGTTGVTIRGAATTYDHQQVYSGVTTINPGTSLTFADGTAPVFGNGLFAVAVGNVAGDIVNNGSLIFNSSHDQTIGTASFYDVNNILQTRQYGISGNGSVIKAGTNTLTTTEASFLNNLTITGGVFQAGDGTTAINGSYNISNGGALRLNSTGNAVLTLTGTGSFESYGAGGVTLTMVGGSTVDHFGPGTVTLTAGNTNTGKVRVGSFTSTMGIGNTVGGGTLVISGDSSLGAAPATYTADALAINGGTLVVPGSATLGANRGVTIGTLGATINPGVSLTIPTPLRATAFITPPMITVSASSPLSVLNLVLLPDTLGTTPFHFAVNQGTLNLDNQGANALMNGTITAARSNTVNFLGGGTTTATAGGANFLGQLKVASGTTLRLNGDLAGDPDSATNGINSLQVDGTLVGLTAGSAFQSIGGAGSFESRGNGTTVGIINLPTGSVTVPSGQLISTSTYLSGSTTLGHGAILKLASGNTGALTLGGTSTFDISNVFNVTGAVSGSGDITKLGAGGLNFRGGGTVANNIHLNAGYLGGGNNTTLSGIIDGAGGLFLAGTGVTDTLRLTANNTYTGGTLVSVGELVLGNGGYTGSVAGDITVGNFGSDVGGVTFNRAGSLDGFQQIPDFFITNRITGSGHLTQAGTGRLIVDTALEYTGPTYLNGGTLQIGNGGTTGSLSLDVPADLVNHHAPIEVGNIVNHAALVLNRSDALALDNDITGTGTLTQAGAGTATLRGALSYTGATSVSTGTLELVNGFANAGGTTIASGAALSLTSRGNLQGTIANAGSINLNRGSDVNSNNDALGYYTLDFTTTGNGVVNKLDSGKAYLSGLAQGNVFGIFAGSLGYNIASGTSTSNIRVTGPGTFLKDGAGTLVLTEGSPAASFLQNVLVSRGTLQYGTGGTTGLINASATTLENDSTVAFNLSSDIFVGNISGSGSVHQMGSGVLNLGGTNTFTGATVIDSGTTLLLDGSLAGNITNNGTLRFSPVSTLTVNSNSSGTGLMDITRGAVTLTGLHTFTGGTTIALNSSLTLSPTASLAGNIVNHGNLTLMTEFSPIGHASSVPANLSGEGTFTIAGGGEVVLGGTPTYTGETHLADGSTLTFYAAGTSTLVNSVSGTGNFRVDGGGTLVLWKGGFITGSVEVKNGTLQFGDGTAGDANNDHQGFLSSYDANQPIQIGTAGTVAFNLTTSPTISTPFTGSGNLHQMGPGAVTITGNNSGFTGTTTVDATRVLNLGTGGTLGSCPIVLNGFLNDQRTNTAALLNDLSGSSTGRFTRGGTDPYSLGAVDHSVYANFAGEFRTGGALDTYTSGGALAKIYASSLTNHGTLTVNELNVNSVSNSGNLTLTGTYSSPITNTGYLTIGNGGTTGAVFHEIANNNGILAYNREDDIQIGLNHITGGGSIEQRGTGKLSVYSGAQPTDSYYIDASSYRAFSGTLELMQPVDAAVASAAGSTVILRAGTYDRGFAGILGRGIGKLVTVGNVNLAYSGNQYGAVELGTGIVTLAGIYNANHPEYLTTLALDSLGGTGTLDLPADEFSPLLMSHLFAISGDSTHTGSILVDGWDVLAGGSLASNLTFSNGGSLTFHNIADATFSGSYSGIDKMTAAGPGKLTVTSSVGAVDVLAGQLTLGHGGAINKLVLANRAGASFALAGHDTALLSLSGGGALGGNISLGAQTLTVDQALDTIYAGAIGGSGKLVKQGNAALELAGANTFSGGVDIFGGKLVLSGTMNSAGGYTVRYGAGLYAASSANFGPAPAQNQADFITLRGGKFEATGPITLSSTQGIFLNGDGTLAGNLTVGSNITSFSGDTLTIGNGRVVIDSATAYNGPILVQGTLGLGHLGAIDATQTTFAPGSSFDVNGHSLNPGNWTTPLNLESATLANGSSTAVTVSIPITASSAFGLDGSGGRMTFEGALVGSTPISLAASGDVLLRTPSASRITSITVRNGNLDAPLNSLTALTDVTAGDHGILQLTGSASGLPIVSGVRDLQLASVTLYVSNPKLSNGGLLNNTDAAIRLTTDLKLADFPLDIDRAFLGGSKDVTLAGTITGATDIAKVGTGKLTIQSDISGWQGMFHLPSVDVREGTLAANSTFYSLRHLTIASGATAMLTNSGTPILRSLTGSGLLDLGSNNLEFRQANSSLPSDGVFTGTVTTTGSVVHNDAFGFEFGTTTDKQSYGTLNAASLYVNAGDVTVTNALNVGYVFVRDHLTTTTNGLSSAGLFTGNLRTEGVVKFLGGQTLTGNSGLITLRGAQASLLNSSGARLPLASNSGTLHVELGALLTLAPTFTNTGAIYSSGRSPTNSPSFLSGIGTFNQVSGLLSVSDTALQATRLNISGGDVILGANSPSAFQKLSPGGEGGGNSPNALTNPGIVMTGGSLSASSSIAGGLQINGGTFGTGANIANVRINNGLVLGSTGKIVWKIANAGVFGDSNSYVSADSFEVGASNGRITVQSTPAAPFTVAVNSGTNLVSDFVGTQDYAWTLATSTGVDGFASDKFVVDDSKFAVAHTGNFGITKTGNTLQVIYNWSYVYDNAADLNISTDLTPGANNLAAGDTSVITREFGGVTKLGVGTLTLNGNNTYSGTTKVTAGILVAGSSTALGTGGVVISGTGKLAIPEGVAVANKVTLSGGSLERTLTGSLAHSVDATSQLGFVNTTATILAGSSPTATTLVTSFSPNQGAYIPGSEATGPGHFAAGSEHVFSDIYAISGTGAGNPFVLQLSIAGFTAQYGPASLGWLDPSGQWVNAVAGNLGTNLAQLNQQGYAGTYDSFKVQFGDHLSDYLGAWGTYSSGDITQVWAVIDHNSSFAVTAVPEPSTWGIVIGAMLCALALHRRRRMNRSSK